MLVRTHTRTYDTEDPAFENSLSKLARIRKKLAASDYYKSFNASIIITSYTARSVWDFFSYNFGKMIFFPIVIATTFIDAKQSWLKLYFEYQIQNRIRFPSLSKAIVDTLIFAATGTAILGAMLAAGVFSALITPVLILGGCALKSAWDFASAAGHFHESFNTTLTPHERQANRKATYKSLLSGVSNLLVVAGLGLLQFTGILYLYPLVIGVVATVIGVTAAMIKRADSTKIEVVKTVSTTGNVLNALSITRQDVLYGLERTRLQAELPSVHQTTVPLFQMVPNAVGAILPGVAPVVLPAAFSCCW